VTDDVDDGTLPRSAELRGKGTGEDFERVDRARIDDLAEVRRRPLWQRHAVDLVGEAVEAVCDGLVIGIANDARYRFDHAIEALIIGKGGDLRATDGIDGDGRGARTLDVRGLCPADFFESQIDIQGHDAVALDVQDLRVIGKTVAVRGQRVATEGDTCECECAARVGCCRERRTFAAQRDGHARRGSARCDRRATHETCGIGKCRRC